MTNQPEPLMTIIIPAYNEEDGIAEIVENTLPTDRVRSEMHKHPNYYPLRNHLLDFLVVRSRELAGGVGAPDDPRQVPVHRPVAGAMIHALPSRDEKSAEALRLAVPTR